MPFLLGVGCSLPRNGLKALKKHSVQDKLACKDDPTIASTIQWWFRYAVRRCRDRQKSQRYIGTRTNEGKVPEYKILKYFVGYVVVPRNFYRDTSGPLYGISGPRYGISGPLYHTAEPTRRKQHKHNTHTHRRADCFGGGPPATMTARQWPEGCSLEETAVRTTRTIALTPHHMLKHSLTCQGVGVEFLAGHFSNRSRLGLRVCWVRHG